MATPTYYFRDDLQAEDDRIQNAAAAPLLTPRETISAAVPEGGYAPSLTLPKETVSAQVPQGGYAQPQTIGAGGGGDPFSAMGAQLAQQPKPTTNPFDDFNRALAEQDPFRQQLQQGVADTLKNPFATADASIAAARDRMAREENVEAERRRGEAITAFGGYGTQQAGRVLDRSQTERLMRGQEFELEGAAARAGAGEAARQGAVAQGLGLLQERRQGAQTAAELAQRERESLRGADIEGRRLGLQEKLGFADLSLRERSLAQEASQFATQAEFQRYALEKGFAQDEIARMWQASENEKERASREKLTLADLSLKERSLAQDASQFSSEQEFRKYALERGFTESEIARTWQAGENEKERIARERLALAEIGSREKLEEARQRFESGEAALNRSLESMLSQDRIRAQFELANLDQVFQERMQASEYLNNRELQVLRQDFEKDLQARGFDQQTAVQLADQKFAALAAERDQAFQSAQAAINRQWETGERIGAQDWQTSIKTLEMRQAELLQERELAVRQGMQTAEIDAELKRTGMQIASQELMSAAQLAQSDTQFREELMLRRDISTQELAMQREKLTSELLSMGLERTQLETMMQNDKVRNAIELATFGIEMGNGSPEAMKPFIAALGSALESALKDQGIDIRATDIAAALTPAGTTGTGGTGTGGTDPGTGGTINTGTPGGIPPVTQQSLEAAQDRLDDMIDTLPANFDRARTDQLLTQLASGIVKPGVGIDSTLWNQQAFPGALANITQATEGERTYYVAKTQEGADFTWFDRFTRLGLTPAQAYALTATVIGEDRVKRAYEAMMGKPWGPGTISAAPVTGSGTQLVVGATDKPGISATAGG